MIYNKGLKIILLIFTLLLVGYILGDFFPFSFWNSEEKVACTMEAKQCSDGSYVSRVSPNCEFALCPGEPEGILISSPKRNEKISNPFKIEGEAKGSWFFEAQFSALLLDADGNKLGEAILTAKSDWMTDALVPFEGELSFGPSSTSLGILQFLSANPSGLAEYQKIFEMPVQFTGMPYRKVLLYYYDFQKDKDELDNIKCSRDGLVAIEREIPVSKTPIQDTINLLLKGKENLGQKEIEQGINTEYPLEGLSLTGADFQEDGTLTLKFNDSLNQTSGGSCRANLLWFQIEATAKQFSGVQQVNFAPKEIFQP